MKRFLILQVFLILFVSAISAQSGRRVAAPPSTDAVVEEKDDDFSESKPTKMPQVYLSPGMRREMEKRKRESQKSKQKTDDSKVIPDTSNTTQTVGEDEDTITVDTNLVTVPVSVFDRNGLYIPNLQQSDFKIYENGKQQEIGYFGTSDKPFTVILLLDTSPSTEYKIEEIQNAAIAFTNQLKPQDNVMVIEFDPECTRPDRSYK